MLLRKVAKMSKRRSSTQHISATVAIFFSSLYTSVSVKTSYWDMGSSRCVYELTAALSFVL